MCLFYMLILNDIVFTEGGGRYGVRSVGYDFGILLDSRELGNMKIGCYFLRVGLNLEQLLVPVLQGKLKLILLAFFDCILIFIFELQRKWLLYTRQIHDGRTYILLVAGLCGS
jgi:hypothetical protein